MHLQCFLGSVVPNFPMLGRRVRDRLFGRLSAETRFACCRPDSSQLVLEKDLSVDPISLARVHRGPTT